MRVLYLPSVQACGFGACQRGSNGFPTRNFCRSDKKSLAKCHEPCLLVTWWQKMLGAIMYVSQVKGDQNWFHLQWNDIQVSSSMLVLRGMHFTLKLSADCNLC